MTGPTLTRPARPVDAPLGNPAPHQGLYTAATLVEDTRLSGGLLVRQSNCVAAGTWPPGCTDVDEALEKDGRRTADRETYTTGVYSAYRCRLIGVGEAELAQLAAQGMRLQEPIQVEAFLAPQLLEAAGAAAAAAPLARALGAVEAAIGATGMAGVIHAPRWVAALAAAQHLLVPAGTGQLTTPLGNRWAFGAGYDGLGDTLVGTGPVTVTRDAIDNVAATPGRDGEQLVVAERTVTVGWECVTVAQALTV